MFLKHHDVKQKKWRMRKVKKVFVSSCMLLTVGLGVAVPTAFNQSNGVMVVKAAEVPKDQISLLATWDKKKGDAPGRFYSESYQADDYKFFYIPSDKLNTNKFEIHAEGKNDHYVKVSTSKEISGRFKQKQRSPYSFGFKVNTKDLKSEHDYKVSFNEKAAGEITTAYYIGKKFEKIGDGYSVKEESEVAQDVVVSDGDVVLNDSDRKFKNHNDGAKTITFKALNDGAVAVAVLASNKDNSKDQDITFSSFKMIDTTDAPIINPKKSTAFAGDNVVKIELDNSKRNNFKDDIVEVYRQSEDGQLVLLKKQKLTTKNSPKATITLDSEILKRNPLKKNEKLVIMTEVPDSGKKQKQAGQIIVEVNPDVIESQRIKKESLNQVKLDTIAQINRDNWLSDTEKEQQRKRAEEAYNTGTASIDEQVTTEGVEKAYTKYAIKGAEPKTDVSIPGKYVQGEKAIKQEQARESLKRVHEDTLGKIRSDDWLTEEEKATQIENAKQSYNQGENKINQSDSLKTLNQILKDYTSEEPPKKESIPNKYEKGKREELKRDAETKLREAQEATKQAIENDPWLSPEQKKAQKEKAKARLDAGLKAVETTESLDKLKEVESDFLDKEKAESIPSQHQAGTPEVARKTFLDNFEKEAKKEIESIKNDVTLTDAEKATAKAKVEAQLQEAKGKAKESKSFDDLKNIQDKFNSELPHTPGKPLKDQQSDAIAELEKKQQEIEKAIEGDKTLPRDEKKKQIADSKERLKSDTQKVKDAKNADAIKKAFEEGKVNIPQAHIPGDLNKDKEKLLAELKQKADDTEKAIDSDKTLTAKEKEEQKAKTKEELQKATEAVGAIDNREELDKKVPELKKAIEDTHVKGNLEGIKNKAIEDLKKVHDETVVKINGDDTLDKATKEAQVKEADKALAAGKEAITKADDADKVSTAVTEHTPKIKAAHKTGDLKKAQEEANTALDKAAEKEREEINNDITLTAKDKEQQLKEVETALTKAKDNVKAAKTADAINDARDKGVATIDAVHKAGQDLGARKSGQVAKLEEAAKATKDKISADPTLTSKEKEEQSKAVDAELKKAIEAVNAADTADKVDDALGKGVTDIKNQHKTGDPVEARREAHSKELDRVAQETKGAIEKDPTLTTEEKAKQVKDVDAAKERGMAKLNEAKNADELDKAHGDGVTNIKNQHKSGDSIDARREAHGKELDRVAQETKGAIEKDPTLTTEEKAKQVKDVDAAKERGMAKLTEAKDADELDKAYGEGVTDIKNQHKSGDPIEARRGLHNKSIDEVAQATKDAITADTTLTEAEKEIQRGNVDKEATKAKEELAKAKDADALDKAYGDGVTSIKNQHKSGDPIEARRGLHNKSIDEVAQATKDAITADTTLTEAEKETQRGNVDKEATKAKEELAKAKDADALDKAYGDGVTNIKNQHKSGDSIDARRRLHNKSIDEVAQATKDAITADTTLTEAEKETQRGNVDKEATKAKEELAKAKDADALDKAYGDGVTSIKNQHKSGKGLDVRKDEHKKALEAVAKRVTAEIEADPTLTPEVREQQKAEVQKELELATDKIAEAKDADEADKAYGGGVTAIENAHVIGKGIEARKDLAKKDLAEAVAKTKALIIEDKTLTDDQRKEQLSGVDTEYAKGIENIDAAKDAAGVDKAYSDGVRDILAQYKEGQNLDDRRNAAKEFLLKEADKVTKLINDDPTLTHDQKVDQINKVEQAKLDAIKSVDDAQTADAINDALGKGIENINNQYQHGDGVDVRKATAKGDLEKEAAKVKALIAKDPTLTQADKDKQTAAVDAAKNTAIAAVDKATTADGVNQELGKGITAINKAYRPGEGVKARKEAAKADLEKEAAKVKALIAKDPTLTQADKDKQTAAVDAAKNTAIAAVDKATTAEGINQELGKGITAINKAYRPGEG
ncbi:TPA: DUF1542 domain-containing protein, partial [Streptococcus pyogenes]